ncbi:GNAT family N-acetyltransferase [Catalinimonas alkaloidigena]|uniref:GNAT family N-acetyltransferase n=1 Tax=Catalinimonas alkaloidigena TaxID=1075417 RepID=UPI0024072224|nr:GNAT family protein [Catalinimonas alkaloidigena]
MKKKEAINFRRWHALRDKHSLQGSGHRGCKKAWNSFSMIKTELLTARLSLKKPVWEDIMSIHHLHSLAETDQYNTLGIPQHVEETENVVKEWIQAYAQEPVSYYTFVIREVNMSISAFVGVIALKLGSPKYKIAEVWYKVLPQHWGKGYATEALLSLIDFGFKELKLHRIEAGCAVDNLASIRVLEKVGMQREGRKRKILPLKSGWSDNYGYAILEEDYTGK